MLRNSQTAWGAIARGLHWIVAFAVIFSVGFGWWMTHLAERAGRLSLYQFHSSVGYGILLLLLLRLGWRLLDPAPPMSAGTLRWERIAARTGHVLLYLDSLAVTISGWLLLGTMRQPIEASLLGLLSVPVPALGRGWHEALEETHEVLSYLLLALIVVHVAGALRHHFVKKNDILKRMW
jgi:cytochrome b561